ncbi:alpha/beta-tubulin-N-acetyltransferase 9 isoform X1 [Phyllobates terribilis]|uniref:alpha/beta-tubulin-N-acetyltransferase 9 isoform X1 n=2 Tax=Phyllobates terribilis TaxID=111132 RepID=UPI003CCA86E2
MKGRAMRVNEDTVLRGHRVLLVPYEPHHVPRYHEWMKSEELQKLTASEPLTLDKEYDMQRSWREDSDKCTFIILDREQWDEGCPEDQCMLGDVNLFLVDPENPSLSEIEIMIAEPMSRGKGFGEESVRLMLYYGVTTLGISTFQAKIGEENVTSIRLFNRLHFSKVSYSSIFQETTQHWEVSETERQWLLNSLHVTVESYREMTQSKN